jgi:hypothetical protein
MHFHLFPPPPLHILPLLLTAALAFAAGMFFVSRRGIPQALAGLSDRLGQRVAFWRRSCQHSGQHSGQRSGQRSGMSNTDGLRNSAFEDYRRATLETLESEAAEFRTFLDGLRRAADSADFEAFLKSRRNAVEPS